MTAPKTPLFPNPPTAAFHSSQLLCSHLKFTTAALYALQLPCPRGVRIVLLHTGVHPCCCCCCCCCCSRGMKRLLLRHTAAAAAADENVPCLLLRLLVLFSRARSPVPHWF